MEGREDDGHYEIPKKAKVRRAIEYMEAKIIPHFKEDVFRSFGVSQGWAMISDGSVDRRHHNREDDIKKLDRILQEGGFEARSMSWEALAWEAGLDVSGDTIKRALGSMDYHMCIACRKGWVSKALAKQRVECHVYFALGPQDRIYIIRRPGERHCGDSVGYDFKSDLTFYTISSNSNGKMTQRAYIDKRFILEEDGDSGHGPGKSNIGRTWKQKHDLKHYFNCPSSPDLSPIENCWQPPKQYDTRELALEGWERVSQSLLMSALIL
ncbi:hypothetical protein K469DRAFT_727625 [Zopfia rhizophila CBS 207.26]|uniref:Tc1-like transposase DDE domain-containing protein n=1 Tax=Zopfia rhizophila CBS 207.26 TaxID=1314779 RepID=A0A6A6ERW7_9PEZI|nr:hypothetical protein K469DRAFT_727625 [Zopfia rhizophila CBS 207.26]